MLGDVHMQPNVLSASVHCWSKWWLSYKRECLHTIFLQLHSMLLSMGPDSSPLSDLRVTRCSFWCLVCCALSISCSKGFGRRDVDHENGQDLTVGLELKLSDMTRGSEESLSLSFPDPLCDVRFRAPPMILSDITIILIVKLLFKFAGRITQ